MLKNNMYKITFSIILLILSYNTFSQEVRETKSEILKSITHLDFIYDTPVKGYTENDEEYLLCKSKITDISYKFIFDEDQICTKIVWDIPSKESMIAISKWLTDIYKYAVICDNKWVQFNDKKHGSLYYELDQVDNNNYTLTIW